MEKETFIQKFKEIVKGQFTKAQWCSGKTINGVEFKKVSSGVIRFVSYKNINGVVVKGKTNENDTIDNECEFLHYNSNTQNYSIQFSTTKVKPMVSYYSNGVEITKNEYENNIPPRKPRLNANGEIEETPVFRVSLKNLISIG